MNNLRGTRLSKTAAVAFCPSGDPDVRVSLFFILQKKSNK